jgi:hypothetical protein
MIPGIVFKQEVWTFPDFSLPPPKADYSKYFTVRPPNSLLVPGAKKIYNSLSGPPKGGAGGFILPQMADV